MKRLVFILLLGFLGNLTQAQTLEEMKWKYQNGQGDGYDGSLAVSYIWDVYYPQEICVGEDAMLSVQVGGGALFAYKWYQVGKEDVILSKTYYLIIPNCKAVDNGREFLCQVTDLSSGQVFETEEAIRLNVMTFPTVSLSPSVDTAVCYGETIALAAKPIGDQYFYTWEGKGVVGSTNSYAVNIRPEESAKYRVTVSNGRCSGSAEIQINVRKPAVELPSDLIYTQSDGQIEIIPSYKSEGVLNWKVGNTVYNNKDTLRTQITEISTIVANMADGRCVATDSCQAIPEIVFGRYVGGEDDGFIASKEKLTVAGISPVVNTVCIGETAFFSCKATLAGTYTFQWWKVGENGHDDIMLSGATDKLLTIEVKDATASGKYYCVVYDLDSKEEVKTDPSTLVALAVPDIEIISPASDTTICAGTQIQLRASREADDDEIYRWSGYNIVSNSTYREVTVAPTESTSYQVMVMRGKCLTTRKITVNVKEVEVSLPEMVDVLKGESVEFSLEGGSNTYLWTVDGHKYNGSDFSYIPTTPTVVKVTKRNGACVASDSCQIFMKEYGVGSGDSEDEDGYTESVLPFQILAVECPKTVCVNSDALLNIEVSGYDVYEYTWKKKLASGKEAVIDSVNSHLFSPVKKDDAGTYFCEVRDVRSGEVVKSDEVTMEVLDIPDAEIASPKNGKWLCHGESIELKAYSAGSNVTYLWEGLNITGPNNELSTTVAPLESSSYSLVVSNGTCSAITYVQINVQNISIDIPEVAYVNNGSQLELAPSTTIPDGAVLTWSWSGSDMVGNVFKKNINESTLVKVKMEYDGCEAFDSTRVYVKSVRTFTNGSDDGYIESNSNFRILEFSYPNVVCENADADFSVRVSGSGVYTYVWKQKGKDKVLSTESTYTVPSCQLSMTGDAYYCIISDLMVGKQLTTDTATLQIRKGPKAIINFPERGKNYCEGTPIRLYATDTENSKEPDMEYVYSWEGENITETERDYVVDIRPTNTQVYTLKVAVDGCVDYDTIKINILKPKIDIPSVVYVNSGDLLSVKASVSDATMGATVNWWHEALFIPNQNPYEVTISESANLVAEVVDQGCKAHDTARIYVRTGKYFYGGEDDGFMESCDIPAIEPDVATVLGCGGVDSVSLLVKHQGGTPENFKWQKYDDLLGYVDLTPADNLKGLGSDNLIINPLSPADYGEYRCILSNDCGSTYSLIYTVASGEVPQLAAHVDTISFCEGKKDQQIIMTLKEPSASQIAYRWYKKNLLTGAVQQFLPEKSYNAQVYTIPQVAIEHDGLYYIEAENACGITKDSVRLVVIKKASFAKLPVDTLVCVNTPVTLKVQAQDGGIRAYTLKKVEPDPTSFAGYKVLKICSGNGSDQYNFPAVAMEDEGYYVWTVKSECGDSVSSNMFKMTVEKPLQFVFQTPDSTICQGTNITLEGIAESPDCPASKIYYSWEKESAGKLPYNTSSITFTFDESSVGNYICYASNVCGKIGLIDPIKLSAHPALAITKLPQLESAGICEEKSLELDFAVNNTSVVDSIRWFKKNGNIYTPIYDSGSRILGADAYKLMIDSLYLEDAGEYRARAYNVCGVYETSPSVVLKVDEKAKIVETIADLFPDTLVCKGTEADLQIIASGKETLLYSWYINDEVVKGASDRVLHVRFDSAATYKCIVHNYCAESGSMATIKVIESDTFRLRAIGDTHYCEGNEGVKLQLAGSDTIYDYTLYRENKQGEPQSLITKSGKSAAYTGGSLDFGTYSGGVYYVKSYNRKTLCEALMPGVVTITMDTLPEIYNALVGTPICEGTTPNTGTIILDGSEYLANGAFKYTLWLVDESGLKQNKILTGTGDTLKWPNIAAGKYRIQAENRETKCSVWMNNDVDLQEHPLPKICQLEYVKGDSVYCSEDEIDLILGMKSACAEGTNYYTLRKDGVLLSDSAKLGTDAIWDALTPARYSVEVKNEWGCSIESNELNIRLFNVPDKKQIKGDKYYCVGIPGEDESTRISVVNVDAKIKYEFFRKGETAPVDAQYKGAPTSINIDVAYKDAVYYVVATDTATGCSTQMSNTVKVQGSKLALSHEPVIMDKADTEVRLNLTVENSIGTPKISWKPIDQITNKDDLKRPWVDMTELTKNVFVATVADSGCVKDENIVILFEGEDLAAEIKNPADCTTDIPNDTLWVCEGAKYSLCGSIKGGNGVYGYEWSQNGKVVGSAMSLVDAVADAEGYLVYRVGSGGRVVKDSIFINVHPAPGKELELTDASDICVALNDTLKLDLNNTKSGVTYTLEYSKTGEIFKTTGVIGVGTSVGNLVLKYPFDEEKAGYYRIKAGLAYDGTMCNSTHGNFEVRRGIYKGLISGGGQYCQRTSLDSIVLDSTEKVAEYRLIYKAEGAADYAPYPNGGTLKGTGGKLLFLGNWPSGSYKVVAERPNGLCVDTMQGVVKIKHLEQPGIGTLVSDKMEYCVVEGETLKVPISLTNCISSNIYKLYCQTSTGTTLEGSAIGKTGEVTFGLEYGTPGRYFAVADNGGCRDTAGFVVIGTMPEKEITLVKLDTTYCAGEDMPVISLKLYSVETGLHYYIYPEYSSFTSGEFTTFKADSAFFDGPLAEGTYKIKAVVGECEQTVGSWFTVIENPLPDEVSLLSPLTACEGSPLVMGVEKSHKNVLYELFHQVDSEIAKREGFAYGTGNDLTIASMDARGSYYVHAEDTTTGCIRDITGYSILPAPEPLDFIATDTAYCAYGNENGTQLLLSKTEFGVTYILQKYDNVAKKYADVEPEVAIVGRGMEVETYFDGIFKAGKYRVRTNTCGGGLVGQELEITEIALPNADITVDFVGSACVDSTLQVVLKSSESDVVYSLWSGKTQIDNILTGDGSDIKWTLNNLGEGAYEIRAVRKMKGTDGCSTALNKKIEVKDLPEILDLTGAAELCEFATTSLKLGSVEKGVNYLLFDKVSSDTVVKGTVSNTGVTFAGVKPGTYYAMAENGDCRNYSDVYSIVSVKAPLVSTVDIDYTQCTVPGKGQIILNKMSDTLIYHLTKPNGDTEQESITIDGQTKTFDKLDFGAYYLQIQSKESLCFSEVDTINLNYAVPAGDTIIGDFGYCDSEPGARLYLGNTTMNVKYSISDNTGKEIESIYGGIGKSFSGFYKEGEYSFKAVREGAFGGCSMDDNFIINKFSKPALNLKVAVLEGGPLCAGNEYHIVVKNAVEDVIYILKKDNSPVDTVKGHGDLAFAPITQSGKYTIYPRNGGICGTDPIDTVIKIESLPKPIFIEQPCSYCTSDATSDEEGAQLKVYDAVEGVRYILTDGTNNLDTVVGDYSKNYLTFKPMKANKYYIVAENLSTGCSLLIDSAEVTKSKVPTVFVCGVDGSRCGGATEVATSDGSEAGVEYYMYRDGELVTGPVTADGGANVSFGQQVEAGIYQIYAQYPEGCGVFMSDSIFIHADLADDTISVKGEYCENGISDIAFRVRNSVPYWNYYIEKDGVQSDTLPGSKDGSPLRWTEVGKEDIRAGKYILSAYNLCGDFVRMDTVTIDTNYLPKKYPLLENNIIVCEGDSGVIMLSNSQSEVFYDLHYSDGLGGDDLMATVEGCDGQLLLKKVTRDGKYTVIGKMKETGCSDTIAQATVKVVSGVPNPQVQASDICIEDGSSDALTVTLGAKADDIHYYLQYLTVTDTTVVDSIKFGKIADLDRMSFESQTGEGIYRVIAQAPTCRKTFNAAKIGKPADEQVMIPVGVGDICEGKTISIGLEGSEKGVDYELFEIIKNGPDSTLNSLNILAAGTGAPLTIGSVSKSGRYIVRAQNGCTSDMKGILQVKVTESYKISLREGYTICSADDSVRIEIVGKTNSNPNARYLIYPPGTVVGGDGYTEQIKSSADQASLFSAKYYKTPGYYRVYGLDAGGCPELDSVKIEVLPLPEVYTISLRGNKYVCSSEMEKKIVVNGAQKGVLYNLYQQDATDWKYVTTISTKADEDEIIFTTSIPGTYKVQATYSNETKLGCPVWMDGEVTLEEATVKQYKLEAVVDAYCERPEITDRGVVKLVNTDMNVSYQLYKDGAVYGAPKTAATAGEQISWEGLSGGMPKMSATGSASPVKYTVVGTDLTTQCEAEMIGTIGVIGERTILFNDDHLADNMPKCIGKQLKLEVLAYGGKISYQWLKNDSELTDETNYYYVKEALESSDINASFHCVMENTCGQAITQKVKIVPNMLVEKPTEGIDTIAICDLAKGEVKVKQLTSSVLNASSWVWYKDGTEIASAINKWVNVSVSLEEGAGTYTCKAYNDCGVLWDTCVILIDSTPRIKVDVPAVIDTLCKGSEYALTVSSDYPVHWMLGNKYTGNTDKTMTLTSVKAENAGAYYVESKNSCGVQKLWAGSLIVDDTVKVVSEQDLFRICRQAGDIPSLFIQTQPKERVTYRWEDTKGVVLGHSNELNYIDLNKYNNHKEVFTAYYGNKCGGGHVDITMLISDLINFEQPVEELKACVTSGLTDTILCVKPFEPRGITYKWYYVGNDVNNSSRDSVGNTDTLKLDISSTSSAGYYYCYLANMCTDTVSRLVSVRVDTTPVLKSNLQLAKTLCAGSDLELSMKGKGGSLTYSWYARKKGKADEKMSSEILFGESQSDYKFKVDTTYNEALIWCDITNSCDKKTTDTMHLTVLPAPEVIMTPSATESCEGVNREIYVTLEKGDLPWSYKYSVDEVENTVLRTVTTTTDTLKLTQGGVFRVYWLKDDTKCIATGNELAVVENKDLKVSEVSMVAVGYTEAVCPNEEVTLKVTISGEANGPWNIEIRRKSDGELASELGFDGPIYTSDREYSCSLKVTKNEEYFARVTNVYPGGKECEAKLLTTPVKLEVKARPDLAMNSLTPEQRILSRCNTVDLEKLFNVNSTAGFYTVDGVDISGNWIVETKNSYTIGFRLYEGSCVYEYPLGDLEFRPRPTVEIEATAPVLCSPTDASDIKISATGEYPLKVTYRILNLKKNGTTQLQTTVPDYEFKADTKTLAIHVSYEEELAGKVYQILRVEDKYKCILEDLDAYQDTVLFEGRPDYKVYSKISGADVWKTSSAQTYSVKRGDSVEVRVELLQGKTPWSIYFNEAYNSKGFIIKDIQEKEKETALKESGLYEVAVQDKSCASSLLDYYPSIEVKIIDTAYINLKAYLQGPWTGAKMESKVLSQIGMRDLTAWPNVGGKQIIDWIEVELWTSDKVLWDTQSCLLLEDGTIVDKKGNSNLIVLGKGSQQFHVALRPRNHLPVWSKLTNLATATKAKPVMIDFTKSVNIGLAEGEASPDNYVYINESNIAFLYGGDANVNQLISSFDPNRITRELLSLDKPEGAGILQLDVNYNGKVEWPGYDVDPTASKDDWAVMYKNRKRFTLVPPREISW